MEKALKFLQHINNDVCRLRWQRKRGVPPRPVGTPPNIADYDLRDICLAAEISFGDGTSSYANVTASLAYPNYYLLGRQHALNRYEFF
jgi:hypothetical protein